MTVGPESSPESATPLETKPYIVGVVNACGGSSRFPLKGTRQLHGLPLIAWIIHAAKGSAKIDRLLVSSDNEEVIDVAREHGAEAPFVRPTQLAANVPLHKITQHAIEFVEREEGSYVNVAVTLNYATPFCSTEDVDGCIDLLLRNPDLDSAFTANEIRDRPESLFLRKGDRAERCAYAPSGKALFAPNDAVFVTRRSVLFEYDRIIGENPGLLAVPPERSVAIAGPIDLAIAEAIASRKE